MIIRLKQIILVLLEFIEFLVYKLIPLLLKSIIRALFSGYSYNSTQHGDSSQGQIIETQQSTLIDLQNIPSVDHSSNTLDNHIILDDNLSSNTLDDSLSNTNSTDDSLSNSLNDDILSKKI